MISFKRPRDPIPFLPRVKKVASSHSVVSSDLSCLIEAILETIDSKQANRFRRQQQELSSKNDHQLQFKIYITQKRR